MFLGHFAAGLAAKSVAPRVSLGTLFLSAQFLDLLWPTLLALGVEKVRIAPGATRVTPLLFEHYPVSHSLLAAIGWAGAFAITYHALRRYPRGALVVAGLVVSHWLLDAIVHRPDLPLYPGSASLVGLEAWSSLPVTLALELALLALGARLYVRATRPSDRIGTWALVALGAALTVIYAANLLGPPPPNVAALVWVGHAQWLLVAWGYWIDRHRSPAAAAAASTRTRRP